MQLKLIRSSRIRCWELSIIPNNYASFNFHFWIFNFFLIFLLILFSFQFSDFFAWVRTAGSFILQFYFEHASCVVRAHFYQDTVNWLIIIIVYAFQIRGRDFVCPLRFLYEEKRVKSDISRLRATPPCRVPCFLWGSWWWGMWVSASQVCFEWRINCA